VAAEEDEARPPGAYVGPMTHPVRLQGFDHIVLRVRDQPRMLRFYAEVLGCELDRERPELGLTHLRAGRDLIDLVTLDGPLGRAGGAGPGAEGRNLDHFCLRVAPFDEAAIRAHLAAHGVEVTDFGVRYGAAGEGPSLYVRDPEGNTVELKGQPAGQ
jgi:catechol 2,3-dioxygenase-like lactoylglutathione lyase family enzyme